HGDLKLRSEKLVQRGRGFRRRLVGKIVAGLDGLRIPDVRRISLPYFGGPRFAVATNAAGRAPQQKHWGFDFAPGREIPGVHLQIDAGFRAIIFADSVDRLRISEAAFEFGKGVLVEEAQSRSEERRVG